MDIDEKLVNDAVKALQAVLKQKQQTDLLVADDETNISIQLGFKKAPTTKHTIKIPLPTSLLTKTSEVCLFVKDMNKKDRDFSATVRHYKELLSQHKVNEVTEVIPLKQLKLEYQPFEAKRNLCNQFNMFLADERVMRLLPAQLGTSFFKRKRQPSQVNLEVKDLKKEITRALTTARCVITGKGSSCMVAIGHSGMTQSQLTENIIGAAKKLAEGIPGGPDNVRGMQIKTDQSMSIPIYLSDASKSDVTLPKRKRKIEHVEAEDVTTVLGGKVKVDRYGNIAVVKDKDDDTKAEAPSDGESEDDDTDEPPAKKAMKSEKQDSKVEEDGGSESSEDEDDDLERQYEQRLSAKKSTKAAEKTPVTKGKGKKKASGDDDALKTPQQKGKTPKKTPNAKTSDKENKLSAKKKKVVDDADNDGQTSAKKKKADSSAKTPIKQEPVVSAKKKIKSEATPATPGKAAKTPKSAKKGNTVKTPKGKTPKSAKKK